MTWIRRSFRNRIFVSVVLITLLPLLLCNVFMLQFQVKRSTYDQQTEAEAQLLAFRDSFTALCDQAEQVAAQLSQSTVVRSVLRRDTMDSRILYQVLFREAQQLRRYARVDVYLHSGICCYTTDDVLPQNRLDPDWGVLYAAAQAPGIAYRAGSEDSAFQAARAVRSYDGTILGYIVVTVEAQDLDLLFGDSYAGSADLLVLDRFWELVYSSRPATAEAAVASLRLQLLSDGSLEDDSGTCRYFVLEEPDTGFFLILQQPLAFTQRALNTFYTISAALGLLCLALCLMYALWLSRYLSQPVNQLDQAMGRVRHGDYSAYLEIDREDELGRLADSFNRMTREYRANLKRSVQRQRELNETQIRMMQAQLNPHFLYNTLDSMKWLGVTHQVPQIAELATDLATILRASISEEEFFTLEQELELIDRYLEIQYIRFEDRFSCEIDVEERFQHCVIPKLALQPLVENAIIHGVADQADGYIKITACQEGADLILAVHDNGCGIPPQILERLNGPDKRIPGRHLGLYNVDQIVRLHFGAGYGISAESPPGEGSCVRLRIPLRRKEQSNAEDPGC